MIINKMLTTGAVLNYLKTKLMIQCRTYHLSVLPTSCNQDVTSSIKATGLKPNEKATITVQTIDDKGEEFFSYAHYRANGEGCIDVEKDESEGGAYNGCLPMGLLSSLQHVSPEKSYSAFVKKYVEKPLKLNISLLHGHVDRDRCAVNYSADCLASVKHERHYMSEGCRKVTVREGKLRGTLFLPPGTGPFPGIIDLFGSAGGLKEFRAAQFASNGIASFALAYLLYDDLPKNPTMIDLEYFENAVHYLLRQEEVIPHAVGVIGLSKGADIALSMGIYINEVKAVVAVNGMPANMLWPMKIKDKIIPELSGDVSKTEFIDGNKMVLKNSIHDMNDYPETILPLETCDAEILFVVGNEDQSWDSRKEAQKAAEKLRSQGRSNVEVLEFEGAGHYFAPPFAQFCDSFYHKLFQCQVAAGGQLNMHSKAEQISWTKMITFFKKHLSGR